MPLQATSGAASYDAFGGGVAVVPTYIEEVFSTWLYTGNGTTQTITNSIDLATYGGLVWQKDRVNAGNQHILCDTARGVNSFIRTDTTSAAVNNGGTDAVYAFNSNGFSTGTTNGFNINQSGAANVSWTFRKQPKFFDIVTYTGTGSARTVAHSLGSTPGCFIVKRTDTTADWIVYHRSVGATAELTLNLTDAAYTNSAYFNNTSPTSTNFTVGTNPAVNASGGTYIAYIFAHDAGGFGLTGTDNVISCGSYVGTGAVGNAVTLGYEPQWLMVKNVTSAFDWIMYDNMRGMPASATNTSETKFLRPNTSGAEAGGATIIPTATGFQANTTYQGANFSGETYIYIAIRRGPMKVPTTGTSVFNSIARTGTGATASVEPGFVTDLIIDQRRSAGGDGGVVWDRLRGAEKYLFARTTAAEGTTTNSLTSFANMNGVTVGADIGQVINVSGEPWINWMFRRAPSFMDEVCYTGNNVSGRAITHNLAAVPELMIVKSRTSSTRDWIVYDATNGATKFMNLNNNSASSSGSVWVSTAPTSTVFTVSDSSSVNDPAQNYVAYLFATCAGVSKVGSYTGNGTTQTIDCGFGAGGARFVLIKATSTTGNWLTFDTARGMTTLTDPVLSLNSTAAETATLGACTTTTGGFTVNEAILAGVNTNGVSFVFLAIA